MSNWLLNDSTPVSLSQEFDAAAAASTKLYWGGPMSILMGDAPAGQPWGGYIPTNNLKAHWTLDEATGTRNDSFGTHHLTDNGSVGSAAGKVGNAADFVPTGESLSRTNHADLQGGDFDYQFTGWIKADNVTGDFTVLSMYGDTAANNAYWLEIGFGNLVFHMQRTAGDLRSLTVGAVVVGTWYFFSVGHNAANDTLFGSLNNGTVVTATSGGTVTNVGSEVFRIGNDSQSSPFPFDGLIDEVSRFNTILTADQLTVLYNDGHGLEYGGGAASGSIDGVVAGSSTGRASLTAKGALTGRASGSSSARGSLTAKGALSGRSAASSTVLGSVTGKGALAGCSSAASTGMALLSGDGNLTGRTFGTSTAQGSLRGAGALSGWSAGTSTVAATLTGRGLVEGRADGTAFTTATLTAHGALTGTAHGSSSAVGELTIVSNNALFGTTEGTSTAHGLLSGKAALSGSDFGSSSGYGLLTGIVIVIPPVVVPPTVGGTGGTTQGRRAAAPTLDVRYFDQRRKQLKALEEDEEDLELVSVLATWLNIKD